MYMHQKDLGRHELPNGIIDGDVWAGRFLMQRGDADIIFALAQQYKTYIEIGVAYGSSACIAGKAGCEVWGIDPLDGRVVPQNTPNGVPISEAVVRANWLSQGLAPDRLHLYIQRHPPWPEEIANKRFDIGFIDGLHTYEAMRNDGAAMLEHVDRVILFHDMDHNLGEHVKGLWNAWSEFLEETTGTWEELDISSLTNKHTYIRGLIRITPPGEYKGEIK